MVRGDPSTRTETSLLKKALAGETTILTTRHDVDHPDFPGHALSDRSVADPDLAVALENRHHPDTPAETQLFRELGPVSGVSTAMPNQRLTQTLEN